MTPINPTATGATPALAQAQAPPAPAPAAAAVAAESAPLRKSYGPSAITRNYALADNGRSSSPSAASSSASSTSSASAPSLAAALFPQNPSIGLRLLGPLVPASDNKPALLLLTTAQLFLGLSLMTRRSPRAAESRLYARSAATLRYTAGAGAVLFSGLEYARLYLPYDPWADEARQWRRWAVKRGYKPSWWAGAVGHYVPMPTSEWSSKISTWIVNTSNALEADEQAHEETEEVLSAITIGPHSALKPGDPHTYYDIYSNLQRINAKRRRESLAKELAEVTELTKAKRMEAVLEGSDPNPNYSKPSIELGSYTMESAEEFDMVWMNFDPWDELAQDTDYDIRWIPRWRSADEEAESG